MTRYCCDRLYRDYEWDCDLIIDDDMYGFVDEFGDDIKQYQVRKGQQKQKQTLMYSNFKTFENIEVPLERSRRSMCGSIFGKFPNINCNI